MKSMKRLAFGSVCALTFGMASTFAMAQAAQQGQYGDPAQQGQYGDPAQQQQQGAGQYGAPAQQQSIEVSDEQLQTYVEAEQKVQEVRQDFQAQMQNAETPEEAQSLQQEAQNEMVSAVEDAGLSVEEYNQIATAMQTDPELRQRMESLN